MTEAQAFGSSSNAFQEMQEVGLEVEQLALKWDASIAAGGGLTHSGHNTEPNNTIVTPPRVLGPVLSGLGKDREGADCAFLRLL